MVAEQPVAQGDIRLILNGADVSNQLAISGTSNAWSVAFAGLQTNRLYTANISAKNAAGVRTRTLLFDTFREGSVIEAEDFNFGSGQFFDDPILCSTLGGGVPGLLLRPRGDRRD